MTDTVSNSGAAVTAADFRHSLARQLDLVRTASPGPGYARNGTGRTEPPESTRPVRKTFSIDSVPGRAPTRITADLRYLLYLNGREVSRGPIRSQPRRMFYDLFDLAPYLQAGENVLAVYVTYYGGPKSYWMPAAPTNVPLGKNGVLVFEANLGSSWLVSDDSWKAHKSNAWSEDWKINAHLHFMEEGIPVEVFDARQFPFGWEQPGFEDSAWQPAAMISTRSMVGAGRSPATR